MHGRVSTVRFEHAEFEDLVPGPPGPYMLPKADKTQSFTVPCFAFLVFVLEKVGLWLPKNQTLSPEHKQLTHRKLRATRQAVHAALDASGAQLSLP